MTGNALMQVGSHKTPYCTIVHFGHNNFGCGRKFNLSVINNCVVKTLFRFYLLRFNVKRVDATEIWFYAFSSSFLFKSFFSIIFKYKCILHILLLSTIADPYVLKSYFVCLNALISGTTGSKWTIIFALDSLFIEAGYAVTNTSGVST